MPNRAKYGERGSPDCKQWKCGRRDDKDGAIFPGCEYTPDEVEFMLALHRYKTENQRPAPTWAEVLAVARALGYRKVNEGESLGTPPSHHGGGGGAAG